MAKNTGKGSRAAAAQPRRQSGYAPSDIGVREAYAWSGLPGDVNAARDMTQVEQQRKDFDRWLTDHDAEVRAEERAKRPDREQIARTLFLVDNPDCPPGRIHESTLWASLHDAYLESADAVLALEPEAREEPTVEEWQELVSAERARQVAIGYDEKHDSEHGIGHLLRWADDYLRRGEVIKGAALVKAARTLDEIEARRASKASAPEAREVTDAEVQP